MGRSKRTTVVAAFATAVALCGPLLAAVSAAADDGGGHLIRPVANDSSATVLNQINAVRAANGCGPVASNPQLAASAARHAQDIVVNGAQGHTGSDGSSVVQRVAAAGYSYRKLGEIVFTSTGPGATSAGAVNGWMNSPRHREIIVDCGFTEAGFSVVATANKVAVTGDFGRR